MKDEGQNQQCGQVLVQMKVSVVVFVVARRFAQQI